VQRNDPISHVDGDNGIPHTELVEILGKLIQPSKPRKIIRVISGKNKDALRQVDDSPAKKSKRPAPVVAEAYR
jgi:hypothetical protein